MPKASSWRIKNNLLLFSSFFETVNCFHVIPKVNVNVYSRTFDTSLLSKLFNDEEYDDGFGENFESSNEEGKALAMDFYAELKKRTMTEDVEDEEPLLDPATLKPQDTIAAKEVEPEIVELSTPEPTPIKFTGRSSSQMFSRSSDSSSTENKSVQERMMEREYRLVERAERNLLVQGGFAALALAFYIYIGLSGGINRSEESLNDFGGDDLIPFEQVAPIQRDRESSVWL